MARSALDAGSPTGSQTWVFAYGSLLGDSGWARPGDAVLCELVGWRRGWTVAMDNGADLPGYKHYLDGRGERPAILVAFLDVLPAAGSRVNGLALPVNAAQLSALDGRERNYARAEVGASIQGAVLAGTVWTYVGLPVARDRAHRGLAEGRLAVSRRYWEQVRAGFERLGEDALHDFEITTDPLPGPLAELRVVPHGPDSAHAS